MTPTISQIPQSSYEFLRWEKRLHLIRRSHEPEEKVFYHPENK